MGEVVNIETTSSHIGGHEELNSVLTEFLHGEVALLLTEVTVQSFCVVTILDEFVGNLLGFQLRATEDDSEYARVEVDDTLQRQILVFRVYKIIDMVDVFSALVSTAYDN